MHRRQHRAKSCCFDLPKHTVFGDQWALRWRGIRRKVTTQQRGRILAGPQRRMAGATLRQPRHTQRRIKRPKIERWRVNHEIAVWCCAQQPAQRRQIGGRPRRRGGFSQAHAVNKTNDDTHGGSIAQTMSDE